MGMRVCVSVCIHYFCTSDICAALLLVVVVGADIKAAVSILATGANLCSPHSTPLHTNKDYHGRLVDWLPGWLAGWMDGRPAFLRTTHVVERIFT